MKEILLRFTCLSMGIGLSAWVKNQYNCENIVLKKNNMCIFKSDYYKYTKSKQIKLAFPY